MTDEQNEQPNEPAKRDLTESEWLALRFLAIRPDGMAMECTHVMRAFRHRLTLVEALLDQPTVDKEDIRAALESFPVVSELDS
jgi:hypothetical protein